MLFKIETTNPFNEEPEYYAVIAENENQAKINFSMKYPSFKVRNVSCMKEKVIKINE